MLESYLKVTNKILYGAGGVCLILLLIVPVVHAFPLGENLNSAEVTEQLSSEMTISPSLAAEGWSFGQQRKTDGSICSNEKL